MSTLVAYAGLFWVALLAATIFPAQSEIVLLALLLSEQYVWWTLILVATVGNTTGSAINWLIGLNLARLERYRWFPIQRHSMEKAEVWYWRYGKWSLLMSWVPIVGDPLTVVAGVLRERFSVFLVLILIAKLSRYLVVVAIAFGLF